MRNIVTNASVWLRSGLRLHLVLGAAGPVLRVGPLRRTRRRASGPHPSRALCATARYAKEMGCIVNERRDRGRGVMCS